jgi:hypothetical protein
VVSASARAGEDVSREASRVQDAPEASAAQGAVEPPASSPGPSTAGLALALLGGIVLTTGASLFAVWADRWYVPAALSRPAYPAALVLACLLTAGWARLVLRPAGSRQVELLVVLVSVAVATAVAPLVVLAQG